MHGGFLLCFILFWRRGEGRNTGDSVAGPDTKHMSFKNLFSLHGFELFCLETQGSEAERTVYFNEISVVWEGVLVKKDLVRC